MFPAGGFCAFLKAINRFCREARVHVLRHIWNLKFTLKFRLSDETSTLLFQDTVDQKVLFKKPVFTNFRFSGLSKPDVFSHIWGYDLRTLVKKQPPSPVNFYKHLPAYQIFFVSFELNYEKKMYLCRIKIKCNQSKTFNEPRRKKWI